MSLRWPSKASAARASLAAVALLYFVVGKVAFEPRLAIGFLSVNQIFQLGVIASLVAMLWCGDPGGMLRSRTMWLTAALALLLALRAVGATNSSYAPAKPLGYLGLVIPSLALFAGSLRGRGDVQRLLVLWALVGSAMMVLGIGLLISGDSPPRLAVFGGGSNGYARMLSTAILVGVGLDIRFGERRRRIWLLTLPGFAVTLLFAGSKTAILGLGISLAVLGLHRGNRRLVLGAVVGALFFVLAPVWTHGVFRHADKNRGEIRMFLAPDTADPRGSYGTRIAYYRRSLAVLAQAGWFGVGTGDWPTVVGLPSGRRHPHNIELELGCELGIVGLAWLATMLVVAVMWVVSEHRAGGDRRVLGTLIANLVFWVFNAQLNGDVLDNRWILLNLLLLEIIAVERRRVAASRAPSDRAIASECEAEVWT
jgi:O-antigen ligase